MIYHSFFNRYLLFQMEPTKSRSSSKDPMLPKSDNNQGRLTHLKNVILKFMEFYLKINVLVTLIALLTGSIIAICDISSIFVAKLEKLPEWHLPFTDIILLISSLIGSLMSGQLVNWIGCKKVALISCTLSIIAMLCSVVHEIFSDSSLTIWLIDLARASSGFAIGFFITVTMVCISEISSKRMQALLIYFVPVVMSVGMLLMYVTEPFWSKACILLVLSILSFVLIFLEEKWPSWLQAFERYNYNPFKLTLRRLISGSVSYQSFTKKSIILRLDLSGFLSTFGSRG
jgi:MFS family permease